MEKIVYYDGTGHLFKASGFTPRIYRGITGRDLFVDLAKLETQEYTPEHLEIYEDLGYTMAKQGNDALPDNDDRKITPFPATPDEWLDTIETFSIYDVLPQIAEFWRESEESTAEAKKKPQQQAES